MVCPWKPFPVRSYNLRARLEQTQLEDLSDASFFGKLLVLPGNVRLDWKVIARYKHSSLFGLVIINEEKKIYNIETRSSSSTGLREPEKRPLRRPSRRASSRWPRKPFCLTSSRCARKKERRKEQRFSENLEDRCRKQFSSSSLTIRNNKLGRLHF
jgi:hypothetical protein